MSFSVVGGNCAGLGGMSSEGSEWWEGGWGPWETGHQDTAQPADEQDALRQNTKFHMDLSKLKDPSSNLDNH